jgi:hypothetical protein
MKGTFPRSSVPPLSRGGRGRRVLGMGGGPAALSSCKRPLRWPYGDELAANFGAKEAPHIVTRALQHAELAVTELPIDLAPGRIGNPIPRQDV